MGDVATRLPGWFYLLIPAGFLPFIVALAGSPTGLAGASVSRDGQ